MCVCLLPPAPTPANRLNPSGLLLQTIGIRLLLSPILMENTFFITCLSEMYRNSIPGISVNLRKMLSGETFIKDTFLLYFFKHYILGALTCTARFALKVPCLNARLFF